MKKVFAMLFAVTMLFALTACGGNPVNQSESAGSVAPEISIAESAPEQTPIDDSQPETGSVSESNNSAAPESSIAESAPEQTPIDNSQPENDGVSESNSAASENSNASAPAPEEPAQPAEAAGSESPQTPDEDQDQKILIAFFSRAGENYNVGVIEKGNTHIIAEMIAEQAGGDLFHIQTVTPYPESYQECTDVAQQELRTNARPELTASVENFDGYDTIFLGYPNWWGDMPMAVYTFLESYDFTGKTIVPFATHEGSGLSSTESSIAGACPGSEVLDGLAIRGSVAQNSRSEANKSVTSWLREAGFID